MKILVIVDQMEGGGGGRVASILLNGLISCGYGVILATDLAKPLNYHVDNKVIVEPLVKPQPDGGLWQKIGYRIESYKRHRLLLKKYRPDVAVAFMTTMFLQLYTASRGLGIPVIVSDHTAMSRNLGVWYNFARRRLYGLADCATILTHKDAAYLGKRVACKEVVYNPLTFDSVKSVEMDARRKSVLCVGRVSSWNVKGFDRIIEMWGKIAPAYPEWILEIAGPGSEEKFEELRTMARAGGCEQSVRILGNIMDIGALYREVSVFALPSRVEGFPMVLIEAMSQGCACISFNLDGAISEIADNGKDCLIIPDNDLEEFQQNLMHLMSSSELRQKLASTAIESVKRYNSTRFIEKWKEIINRVITKRKS